MQKNVSKYAPSHSTTINPYPSNDSINVLFAGHSQTTPAHAVGPQVLDYYLVHYVLRGKGTYHCFGKEYTLRAGDSFFIFPGELQRYEADRDDPWFYRWVGFNGSIVDELLAKMDISAQQPVCRLTDTARIPDLYEKLEHVLQLGKANGDLQASGYFRLILAEYGNNMPATRVSRNQIASEADEKIEQAISWLTLQYSKPISIDEMAHTFGYHRTHFSKIFKMHTGLSPTQFLLKIRMERAKLLLQKSFSVDQVATSVGFRDALYFSKQFKKWHGVSPRQYRESLRGKNVFDCQQIEYHD